MAHDHAAHHHDPDAEYQETPGSSYEHTDADSRSVIQFGLWLAIITVVTAGALAVAFTFGVSQAAETAPPRYPLAAGQQKQLPPEPRLQQFPRTDMYQMWLRDEAALKGYSWADKEKGVVAMPIDEAVRLTLERGLPSRPQDGTVATPGLSASDASSGRVMERRRQ